MTAYPGTSAKGKWSFPTVYVWTETIGWEQRTRR